MSALLLVVMVAGFGGAYLVAVGGHEYAAVEGARLAPVLGAAVVVYGVFWLLMAFVQAATVCSLSVWGPNPSVTDTQFDSICPAIGYGHRWHEGEAIRG